MAGDVTGAAEPSDLEWLGVVVVVPISAETSAPLAGLRDGVGLARCGAGEDSHPVLGIGAVSGLRVALDGVGVAFVEGAVEALDGLASGLPEVATSLGTESP